MLPTEHFLWLGDCAVIIVIPQQWLRSSATICSCLEERRHSMSGRSVRSQSEVVSASRPFTSTSAKASSRALETMGTSAVMPATPCAASRSSERPNELGYLSPIFALPLRSSPSSAPQEKKIGQWSPLFGNRSSMARSSSSPDSARTCRTASAVDVCPSSAACW